MDMQSNSMRSSLGRVRGLGAAREGVGHWWAQRISSVALAPLMLWFIYSAVGLTGADYTEFKTWVGTHYNPALLILFICCLYHHAQLGLQVVIEDYVHSEKAKVTSIVFVKFAAVVLAVSTSFAVLRLTFA